MLKKNKHSIKNQWQKGRLFFITAIENVYKKM